MDLSLSFSSDWWNLLAIPLMFFTLKDVIASWDQLWDDELTAADRALLMRAVIFLLMPVVVLFHELGHYFAALQVGARVLDFHYGPVTGHVTVVNDRTPEESLWISLAGNLVQVLIGLVSLAVSARLRSPPAVALAVYFGLFTIADTVVFYALLSMGGLYGDWSNIYRNPARSWVQVVSVAHGCLIGFLFWCVKAPYPRRWFCRRTMPDWAAEYDKQMAKARSRPGVDSYIGLAELALRAGLTDDAKAALASARVYADDDARLRFLDGRIACIDGKPAGAIAAFTTLQDDESLSAAWRARLALEIGQLWLNLKDEDKALSAFQRARKLDPLLGEALLFKGIVLNSQGRYREAVDALSSLGQEDEWLSNESEARAARELQTALDSLEKKPG